MLRRILLLAFLCGASVSHASFWLAEPNEAAVIELVKRAEGRLDEEKSKLSRLVKRPSSSLQWGCMTNPFDVLKHLGFPSRPDDPEFHSNLKRKADPRWSAEQSFEEAQVVPLTGACKDGQLQGEVSFWFSVVSVESSNYGVNRIPTYGKADLVFDAGASPDVTAVFIRVVKSGLHKHTSGHSIASAHDGDLVASVLDTSLNRYFHVTQRRRNGNIRLETFARHDAKTYRNDDFTRNQHEVYVDGLLHAMQTGPHVVSFNDEGERSESIIGFSVVDRNYPVRMDNKGRYMSPITSDGVAAEWVNKSIGVSFGTKTVGMAGAILGGEALRDVPVVGQVVGSSVGARLGESAGRQIALSAIGGELALAASSDISADSVDLLAGWLVQTHHDHPKISEIMQAAAVVYPELGGAYGKALDDRKALRDAARQRAEEAFHAGHAAAGRAQWVPPVFEQYASHFK